MECCATCKKCLSLERWYYSNSGCVHETMEEYACLAFVDEGKVIWMVGTDKNIDMCECYQSKSN